MLSPLKDMLRFGRDVVATYGLLLFGLDVVATERLIIGSSCRRHRRMCYYCVSVRSAQDMLLVGRDVAATK